MVMNANALTLGVAQGFINYYLLLKKYPVRSESAEMAFL